MKNKSFIMLRLVFVLTIGMLAGCGSKTTDAETAVTGTEENVADESTEILKTEESTETVPDNVTYSDAHGWTLGDLSDVSLPALVYWTDEDGTYEGTEAEGLAIIQPTATYSFGDITVTEPDENGNVVYTIPYRIELCKQVEDYAEMGFGYSYVSATSYGLADMYTGTVFPARSTQGDESYEVYTDIVWDDMTYSVGYTKSTEWSYGDWDWEYNENGTLVYFQQWSAYIELSVTAPADYDGLVLYIYNGGKTEYEEEDYDNLSEAQSFDEHMAEEGTTADDYTFIRVSDYITK